MVVLFLENTWPLLLTKKGQLNPLHTPQKWTCPRCLYLPLKTSEDTFPELLCTPLPGIFSCVLSAGSIWKAELDEPLRVFAFGLHAGTLRDGFIQDSIREERAADRWRSGDGVFRVHAEKVLRDISRGAKPAVGLQQ